MNEKVDALKTGVSRWWDELDKKYFGVMLLFSTFVFFPLISQRLTNTYDGLWTTAEYYAGQWELSNGRWLWPVLSALRFHIQLNPITSLICLTMISLGVTLIQQLFRDESGKTPLLGWLAGLCYVSGTVIGCYLSFHFIAPEYGFSFFFAVAAAYCAIRGRTVVSAIAGGAVFLALSLGLYQSNLACFCLILLAFFLVLLFRNEDKKTIREHIGRSLGSAVLGIVLYWVILQIALAAANVEMADYQGGASVSVMDMLKNLPQSIVKCYGLFFEYFFGDVVRHSVLQDSKILYILAFVVVGAALLKRLIALWKKKDLENSFYGAAAILVMPLASVVFLIAATKAAFYIPMAGGLALFFPVCFWLLSSTQKKEETTANAEKAAAAAAAGVILYSGVFMSAIDQQAMYEGRQATKQIADRIAQALVDEGYFENEIPIMIVGGANQNPLFRTHQLYYKANEYARVGLFMRESAGTVRFSWDAVFRDDTPMTLEWCDDEKYTELLQTGTIREMPVFPLEGSIREIDGVLVIKVSDDYELDPLWKTVRHEK